MRKLTPAERARVAEVAAVIEADIRVSLQGKPITAATLRQAAIEAAQTLTPTARPPIVEIDDADPNLINVLIPADWLAPITRKDEP